MLPALTAALVLSACGGAGGVELPSPGWPDPGQAPGEDDARGVPGFDTREYPGDDVMRAWRDASPYRWVGFYLPAPCYTGTSWQGRRPVLEGMGWRMAVLFVGEQDWADAAHAADAAGPDGAPLRCTRTNLTAERAAADGAAAVSAAAAEGFPAGTVVYLDVERVEGVSDALGTYVRRWFDTVLGDGRYVPGLYAHADNADALLARAAAAFEAAGRTDRPRLWVAMTGGFSLRRGPTESGFDDAEIWQGLLDVTETWGGHALRIDANVAADDTPSG